jgi:LPP20 lipoprotein
MKKALIYIFIALILTTGCASSRDNGSEKKKDIPRWYAKPAKSDVVIYGLGTAKMSNDSMSQNTAISRARTDIAFQISDRLKSVMTLYYQESGNENSRAGNYMNSVNRKVVDIELTDAVLEKIYVATDENWYALVSYPSDKIVNIVTKILTGNGIDQVEAEEIITRLNSSIEKKALQSSASEN